MEREDLTYHPTILDKLSVLVGVFVNRNNLSVDLSKLSVES